MSKRPSLKVPRSLGQKALFIARRLGILDRNLRIISTDTDVTIPLSKKPSENDLAAIKSALTDYRISSCSFKKRRSRPTNLIELLNGRLPPHLLASLPRAYDVVGDVVILELPGSLITHGKILGAAVRRLNSRYRTVLAKAGPVSNAFRTRGFTILAGERSTVTEHSEHGCLFRLDPHKVYFSPRLSYERQRLASEVEPGEVIVDMFAGVGPFSIVIARSVDVRKIYAIDINPEAISFMLQNVRLNRLRGKITAVLADATGVPANILSCTADRVIMNLPEKSLMFIPQSCSFLKPRGGVVHLYTFAPDDVPRGALPDTIREKVEIAGRRLAAIEVARTVKTVAPRQWQLAYDIRIA